MTGPCATLERKWLRIFSALWRSVLGSARLYEIPPPVTLRFSYRLSESRAASIRRTARDGGARIEISTRLAAALDEEINGLQSTLSALLFRSAWRQRERGREVLIAAEELAIGFILLHEIFHLVNGHFGWVETNAEHLGFDEGRLGLHLDAGGSGAGRPVATYSRISDAYVLESEADCSAIQWMVQETAPAGMRRLFGLGETPIQLFPKRRRAEAFRLFLATVWLVIRKLEAGREKSMRNNSKTHPLPVTRLFVAFGMLTQQYCRISGLRFDAQGGGQYTLTERDVASMREFLAEILRPVLTSDWNPGSPAIAAESLEGQMRFYLPDFGNHLLNRPVQTIAGRELLRMERARFRMDRRLRPFRYYHPVELKKLDDSSQ
jgi:hypothetical protein